MFPRLQSKDLCGSVLVLDKAKTKEAKDAAIAEVKQPIVQYTIGQTLAKQDVAIDEATLVLLVKEHEQINLSITNSERTLRCILSLGLIFALFALCGCYIYMHEPRILGSIPRLSILLGMAIFVVGTCHWIGSTPFNRTEVGSIVLTSNTSEPKMATGRTPLLLVFSGLGQDVGLMSRFTSGWMVT